VNAESRVPELIVVRVVSNGAPFEIGEYLSVAYTTPAMGRLVPHAATPVSSEYVRYEAVLPDAFTARVTTGSSSYRNGELLSFSFVDPRFARIHRSRGDDEEIADCTEPVEIEPEAPVAPRVVESADSRAGVLVRMQWSPERARRFVQIVDKLFTVDRLGWYRHTLAMRLLVPDTIECSDGEATAAAMTHLQLLRSAAIAALGRPLLAACMPAFVVTVEWLETVDTPEVARALAGLRRQIAPYVCDEAFVSAPTIGDTSAVGSLVRREFDGDTAASADAFLATLVPHIVADVLLSERLRAYREALCDVFGQTARTTELVRLGRMSEPNHVLDDHLWQLVGVVGKTLGGLAVA
jgi:hypothetical protein